MYKTEMNLDPGIAKRGGRTKQANDCFSKKIGLFVGGRKERPWQSCKNVKLCRGTILTLKLWGPELDVKRKESFCVVCIAKNKLPSVLLLGFPNETHLD